MSESESRPTGLWASATRLLTTFVQLLESRVELFALELQEQKIQLVQILIWTSVAVFLGGLSLVMVTITVLFAFWDDPRTRLIAMGVMCLLYVGTAVFAALRLNSILRKLSIPFVDTLSQIKKDRTWLES